MLEAAQSEDAARNARTLAGKGYEHGYAYRRGQSLPRCVAKAERWRCLYAG